MYYSALWRLFYHTIPTLFVFHILPHFSSACYPHAIPALVIPTLFQRSFLLSHSGTFCCYSSVCFIYMSIMVKCDQYLSVFFTNLYYDINVKKQVNFSILQWLSLHTTTIYLQCHANLLSSMLF